MKIRSITWKRHPILADLTLTICPKNYTIPDIVLIAGENGTGKTAILKSLFDFLNKGSIDAFASIVYEHCGAQYEAKQNFKGEYIRESSSGESRPIGYYDAHDTEAMANNFADLRSYGCAYLPAQVHFSTKVIRDVSASVPETEQYISAEEYDFTKLKQLLCNMHVQDSLEYTKKCSESTVSIPFSDYEKETRVYRFKQAFNSFFNKNNLQFSGVEESGGVFNVIFRKGGKSISLEDLSTGEKQIVFRSGILLSRNDILTKHNSFIFIDEPELSMHPKWEERLLDFYASLFTVGSELQSQIFIATHSIHFVKQAMERINATVIVLKKVEDEIIAETLTNVYPRKLTVADANYLAFNYRSLDLHLQVYNELQEHCDLTDSVIQFDKWLWEHIQHWPDGGDYQKPDQYGNRTYITLPTYIRNCTSHVNKDRKPYTEEEFAKSIECLLRIREECIPDWNSGF